MGNISRFYCAFGSKQLVALDRALQSCSRPVQSVFAVCRRFQGFSCFAFYEWVFDVNVNCNRLCLHNYSVETFIGWDRLVSSGGNNHVVYAK